MSIVCVFAVFAFAQIIVDHTVVDKYELILHNWIDFKTMWVTVPGNRIRLNAG